MLAGNRKMMPKTFCISWYTTILSEGSPSSNWAISIIAELFYLEVIFWSLVRFVGNKAKGRISKRAFEENKVRQIFRKTDISYPLIRTRTCGYQGVRNVRFSENLACFVFFKHPFWDSPFCLITDELLILSIRSLFHTSKTFGIFNPLNKLTGFFRVGTLIVKGLKVLD